MGSEAKSAIRCAIYTRKSSEEGLEQSFNSLEAQREACEAYIASQKHERWRTIVTPYNDGGYSGGSMERPALRQLLADIDAGKIDTVVVYKVDRLTRSLADFAKIIERFDSREVSFVSVTQQFNTTTSMGRLTLNVLLSFAQFEREVTGERIRDKIAASKRKGMWMGGIVPAGYDIKERKLVVNSAEAAQVKRIYQLYVELGCVAKLKAKLDRDGVHSKVRVNAAGVKTGGASYSRGALYSLLQNPTYLGKIAHREQIYEGEQPAIISQELWDKVQGRLRANNNAHRTSRNSKSPSLLVGLLYDEAGNRFTPSHAVKRGRRYRYYISQAVIHHRSIEASGPTRIPAQEIECLVVQRLGALLSSSEQILETIGIPEDDAATSKSIFSRGKQIAKSLLGESASEQRSVLSEIVARITVQENIIILKIDRVALRKALIGAPRQIPEHPHSQTDRGKMRNRAEIKIEAKVKRCGGEVRLLVPPDSKTEMPRRPLASLIKAVARSHRWPDRIVENQFHGRRSIARFTGIEERYAGRVLQCAFLAPDIVEAILDGRQPPDLTIQRLLRGLPLDWAEQRRKLGFPLIPRGRGDR